MPYVCPWWSAPLTINPPFRRLLHDPKKIVGPHLRPGMTVLETGCGVGYFTIPMARMVGPTGKILAVDLQPQMLRMLQRRAEKAGVADRIVLCECQPQRLGVDGEADFALVFAVLHEVSDQARFLGEVHHCLKPGDRMLLAEPSLHVSDGAFANEAAIAEQVGFQQVERPRIRWSKAILFEKARTTQAT